MTFTALSLATLAALSATSAPASAPRATEAAARPGATLPFIEDDYPRALAEARKAHKPVLLDLWATWCHTCLSMKRTVFVDPALAPIAGEVVWASVETETEKNRAVVEKFPLDAWPTFLLIDPADETIIGRWIGAATASDFRAFVSRGVAGWRERRQGGPAAEVARGDAARARGDLPAAVKAYEAALAQTPANDALRPERLVLLASTLGRSHTAAATTRCLELGRKELDHTGDTAIVTDFAGSVLGCAAELPENDPSRVALVAAVASRLEKLLAREDAPLSVDDRSDAAATLTELLDAAKQHDRALAVARERARRLEEAAQKASTPLLASTYDAHRTDTYLYLGDAAAAERLLSAREKELPDDYNPPARLARVLLEEKKLPDAEAAVDRALGKMAKSQRRVGVLGLKVKILEARGKPVRDTLREQLEVLRSLPKPQRRPDAERKLEARLGST